MNEADDGMGTSCGKLTSVCWLRSAVRNTITQSTTAQTCSHLSRSSTIARRLSLDETSTISCAICRHFFTKKLVTRYSTPITQIPHVPPGVQERFWATVCKTVRPKLSDRCPVCLSDCDVGVLWPNGWLHQDETCRYRPRPWPHCVKPWFHVKINYFKEFYCFILTWNHVWNEIK